MKNANIPKLFLYLHFFCYFPHVVRNVSNSLFRDFRIFYPVIVAPLWSGCRGESPVGPSESSFPSWVERSPSSPTKARHQPSVRSTSLDSHLGLITRLRMVSEETQTQSHHLSSVRPTSVALIVSRPPSRRL